MHSHSTRSPTVEDVLDEELDLPRYEMPFPAQYQAGTVLGTSPTAFE